MGSYADAMFKNLCKQIMFGDTDVEDTEVSGAVIRPVWEDTGEKAHYTAIPMHVSRYDLRFGFPILTLRKTNWRAALDEILWIWQKKSNKLEDLNSHIWDQWGDENGTIGKAYGYQLGRIHKFPEGEMDQVDRVLHQLKNAPRCRRIITNMYVHSDLIDMRLEPCAYSMLFNVINGTLHGCLVQRSQDVLVANNWNVVQYSFLMHMFAQVSGLKVGVLTHMISDAHIYNRHKEMIRSLLTESTSHLPAPVLKINPDVTNFYDFTVDDFSIENYQWIHDIKKIPVAV